MWNSCLDFRLLKHAHTNEFNDKTSVLIIIWSITTPKRVDDFLFSNLIIFSYAIWYTVRLSYIGFNSNSISAFCYPCLIWSHLLDINVERMHEIANRYKNIRSATSIIKRYKTIIKRRLDNNNQNKMKLCLDFVFGCQRVLSDGRWVCIVGARYGRMLTNFALASPQLEVGLGRQRTWVFETGPSHPTLGRQCDACLNRWRWNACGHQTGSVTCFLTSVIVGLLPSQTDGPATHDRFALHGRAGRRFASDIVFSVLFRTVLLGRLGSFNVLQWRFHIKTGWQFIKSRFEWLYSRRVVWDAFNLV